MLNGKEGRLLRRNSDKDTSMKINILLCDDDKDFLQRISSPLKKENDESSSLPMRKFLRAICPLQYFSGEEREPPHVE